MKRFHINDAGNALECTAEYNCQYGGLHHPSKPDANRFYERENEREQGSFSFNTHEVAPLSNTIISGSGQEQVATLPAGEYFIGDPYIVIGLYDQEGWNNYVESVDKQMGWENDVDSPSNEKQPLVGAEYAGSPVVSIKAFHGAGLHWTVEPPRRIPSDAALVSAIPMDVIRKLGLNTETLRKRRHGFVHTFDDEFKIAREKNGNINIGDLMVVHNDTLPDEAWTALDKGDNRTLEYTKNEQKTQLRRKTYTDVVDEFLDIKV